MVNRFKWGEIFGTEMCFFCVGMQFRDSSPGTPVPQRSSLRKQLLPSNINIDAMPLYCLSMSFSMSWHKEPFLFGWIFNYRWNNVWDPRNVHYIVQYVDLFGFSSLGLPGLLPWGCRPFSICSFGWFTSICLAPFWRQCFHSMLVGNLMVVSCRDRMLM